MLLQFGGILGVHSCLRLLLWGGDCCRCCCASIEICNSILRGIYTAIAYSSIFFATLTTDKGFLESPVPSSKLILIGDTALALSSSTLNMLSQQ